MNKKVSIILLNYNTSNDAIECIKSLLKIYYENYEIVVVDNNSRASEYEVLHDYCINIEKCKIIKANYNGGFASGNNIGIEYAKSKNSDYILLLNCDTEVEKDFLGKLIQGIESNPKEIAIAISKIKYFSDRKKIWYGGGKIDWNRYTGIHYGEGKDDTGMYDEQQYITFATGCCMLINCSLKFNYKLSEEYFMYYEDVDFSARIIKQNYKILYVPQSIIYHKIGSSSGGEQSAFTLRWSNRGRVIFMNKYKECVNPYKFIFIKIYFYFTRVIKIGYFILCGEYKKAKFLAYGIRDAILYRNM